MSIYPLSYLSDTGLIHVNYSHSIPCWRSRLAASPATSTASLPEHAAVVSSVAGREAFMVGTHIPPDMSDSPAGEDDATAAPSQPGVSKRLLATVRRLVPWNRSTQAAATENHTKLTPPDEPQAPSEEPPSVSVEDERTNTYSGSYPPPTDVTLSPHLSADGVIRYRSNYAEARDGDTALKTPPTELPADDETGADSPALDSSESE
jgi:hypothetical protein